MEQSSGSPTSISRGDTLLTVLVKTMCCCCFGGDDSHYVNSHMVARRDEERAGLLRRSEEGIVQPRRISSDFYGASEDKNAIVSSPMFSQNEEDVCPTCLEMYDEENPRVVTACGHHFHMQCVYEWLERSNKCPVCMVRLELLQD
mmetsp:Transcript_9064/g.18006  ORF Transcript_9064/g.18006 Transcript_9064/m.18006 type:complete len:145 (-) Transcript_9064:129-563(-)